METVRVSFWMRLLAAVVDSIIASVLVWVPTLVLAFIHPALGIVVGGLLAMGYYSLEVFKARSVGKLIFGLTITGQDGKPATRDQLVKRYGYKQIPQVLGTLAAIPFLGFVAYVGW